MKRSPGLRTGLYSLIVAALFAVLTPPAAAQTTPQWPVSVDGQELGALFNPTWADEANLFLAKMSLAARTCNKTAYDEAEKEFGTLMAAAQFSLDHFVATQRSGGQKVRNIVYGGTAIFQRQRDRLEQDVQSLQSIFQGRPKFPASCTPPPPPPPPPPPGQSYWDSYHWTPSNQPAFKCMTPEALAVIAVLRQTERDLDEQISSLQQIIFSTESSIQLAQAKGENSQTINQLLQTLAANKDILAYLIGKDTALIAYTNQLLKLPPCLTREAPEHSMAPAATAPAAYYALGGWHFDAGIGNTLLFPSPKINWLGTGTGGVATATFDTAQAMPTAEFDAWHPLTPTGLEGGFSGNMMLPAGGTTWRSATTPAFTGTMGYQQGFAGSFFGNIGVPVTAGLQFLTGTPHTSDAFASPFVFVGGGFAVDSARVNAVFPGAGDNFRVSHSDFVPAFEAGVKWKLGGSAQFPISMELLFQDWLPGSQVTMPGGNALSFATYRAGNSYALTGKLILPFGAPPPPPPVGSVGPQPATGALAAQPSPQARQVAALAPVAAAPTAVRQPTAQPDPALPPRFTIRFAQGMAALTPGGIRSLDEAVAAALAGDKIEIAIEGCGANDDHDASVCARRAMSLRQLLAQRGVAAPARQLAAELR